MGHYIHKRPEDADSDIFKPVTYQLIS